MTTATATTTKIDLGIKIIGIDAFWNVMDLIRVEFPGVDVNGTLIGDKVEFVLYSKISKTKLAEIRAFVNGCVMMKRYMSPYGTV